jgi:DNA modification methylase
MIFRDYRNGKRADVNFDYGEWDYGWDMVPFLKESRRILKKYGQWLIFTSEQLAGDYRKWLSKNGHFKQFIIWEKTNPLPQFRKCGYRQATEIIVWAYKEKPERKNQHFNFLTQKEMINILRRPICAGHERTKHPTQKPVALIIDLLKRHSFENDIVVDPYIGSGSTAVACIKTGRQFIGVETNKEYCEIAQKRIENTARQSTMLTEEK